MSTTLERAAARALPRLGFLGVGWIGRHRLEAVHGAGAARVHAIADPCADRAREASRAAPGAVTATSLDELLEQPLDGIVIATPSALHAEQAVRALEHGIAVFCQKPLARTAEETRRVIDAARAADRLLAIDMSYRYTAALRAVRDAVAGGAIGAVYAADLAFHNAYGPDRGWARDPALAGGGCVIDLGVHLVDMALWTLGFPAVRRVASHLYAGGTRLDAGQQDVCEDHAVATLELEGGATVRIACSWECSTGQAAMIRAHFTGTAGAAALVNVDGSFYHFRAELYRGTATETLSVPPDEWGGRAIIAWSERLAAGARFDPAVETAIPVAAALDAVLGR